MSNLHSRLIGSQLHDRTSTSRRFDRYRAEELDEVRKPELGEDPILSQLKSAWRAFKCDDRWNSYLEVLPLIKDIKYSSKDVEKFSLVLSELEDYADSKFDEKAGLFLSALINNGSEADYVIHTAHLDKKIDELGYKNTKNITVHGDVGMSLGSHNAGNITVHGNASYGPGYEMVSGKIVIMGNAGTNAGHHMNGGVLIIHGDAASGEEGLGASMKGGIILLKGNTRRHAGYSMRGGTIIIEGNAEGDLGIHLKGGTIVIKGHAGDRIGLWMDSGRIYLKGGYTDVWDPSIPRPHHFTGGPIFYATHNNQGIIYHQDKILIANRWNRFKCWCKRFFGVKESDPEEIVRGEINAA